MSIDPGSKIKPQIPFKGISGSGREPTANQGGTESSTSQVPQTGYVPLNPLTLREKANDRKVIAQFDGLLCRLEAFGIGGNGLSPVEGFEAPHVWMKNSGFPQLPDVAWITREFDKAEETGKATFKDFKATWKIDRENNTLTVTKLPAGFKERFGDPPVVSFPLDSVERYLRQAQPKRQP